MTRPARLSIALAAALALAWAASDGQAASRNDIKEIVVEEALATAVPPSLALAVAKVESDFQARALSPKGARGVMQIMPATASGEFGVAADELWDARLNVQLGIDYLGRLIKRYGGRWDLALSHYNGGGVLGAGERAEAMPATRSYVKSVLLWQRRYADQARVWRAAEARRPAPAVAPPAAVRTAYRPPPRTAIVRTPAFPSRRATTRARFIHIDSRFEGIEQRRRRLRVLLDDFAGARAPSEG